MANQAERFANSPFADHFLDGPRHSFGSKERQGACGGARPYSLSNGHIERSRHVRTAAVMQAIETRLAAETSPVVRSALLAAKNKLDRAASR
jgi:hypothetical protein